VRVAVLDPDGFADGTTAVVQGASARTLIADRVTDQVVLRDQADLISARPIISSAISGVVGSGAFRSLLRRAVLDAHRAVLMGVGTPSRSRSPTSAPSRARRSRS
jgi:hypothetical protein